MVASNSVLFRILINIKLRIFSFMNNSHLTPIVIKSAFSRFFWTILSRTFLLIQTSKLIHQCINKNQEDQFAIFIKTYPIDNINMFDYPFFSFHYRTVPHHYTRSPGMTIDNLD